jgi:hypothetical protein
LYPGHFEVKFEKTVETPKHLFENIEVNKSSNSLHNFDDK